MKLEINTPRGPKPVMSMRFGWREGLIRGRINTKNGTAKAARIEYTADNVPLAESVDTAPRKAK